MHWEGRAPRGMYGLYTLLFIAPSSEAAASDGFSTFLITSQNGSAVTAKGIQARPAVLDVTMRWPLLMTATEEAWIWYYLCLTLGQSIILDAFSMNNELISYGNVHDSYFLILRLFHY